MSWHSRAALRAAAAATERALGRGPGRGRGGSKWEAVICREHIRVLPLAGQCGRSGARWPCSLEYPRRRRPTCAHLQNACQAPCGCPEERRRPLRGSLDLSQRRTQPSGAYIHPSALADALTSPTACPFRLNLFLFFLCVRGMLTLFRISRLVDKHIGCAVLCKLSRNFGLRDPVDCWLRRMVRESLWHSPLHWRGPRQLSRRRGSPSSPLPLAPRRSA